VEGGRSHNVRKKSAGIGGGTRPLTATFRKGSEPVGVKELVNEQSKKVDKNGFGGRPILATPRKKGGGSGWKKRACSKGATAKQRNAFGLERSKVTAQQRKKTEGEKKRNADWGGNALITGRG